MFWPLLATEFFQKARLGQLETEARGDCESFRAHFFEGEVNGAFQERVDQN